MELVALADLHLSWENPMARTDDVAIEQFSKLRYVLDYCNEDPTNRILIIAGDMFDRPRSWYLLPKVIELLKQYPSVRIYAIFGQHDTYLYSETTRKNTNLGILEEAGLVTILGEKPFCIASSEITAKQPSINYLRIYGCHFGQKVPTIIEHKKPINILVIHAPIANKELFPGHEFTGAKSFLRKHKDFDLIICGDIHRQFFVHLGDRIIVNPGPMVRRIGETYNFKHKPSFGEYNAESGIIDLHEIPHKPAEEVLSRDHIEQPAENKAVLDKFIKELKTQGLTERNQGTFAENLQKYLKQNEIDPRICKIIANTMQKEE